LDLSGTEQGAGGVGGLLFIGNGSSVMGDYAAAYDGNGNVMSLLDMAGAGLAAAYEYGPFGELIRSTGAMSESNPYRFSTKYQDDETGLLYYGYRYYQPVTGRWINRDPVEEKGGINLYTFVRNAPTASWDVLGAGVVTDPHPPPVGDLEYTPLPSSFWNPADLNKGPCCCKKYTPPRFRISDNGSSGFGWGLWHHPGTYRVRVDVEPPVCYKSLEWYWHTCQVGNHWGVWLESRNDFAFKFEGSYEGSWFVDLKIRWLTCDPVSHIWVLKTEQVGVACQWGHCN
jgi:RHS repeat-associated protein